METFCLRVGEICDGNFVKIDHCYGYEIRIVSTDIIGFLSTKEAAKFGFLGLPWVGDLVNGLKIIDIDKRNGNISLGHPNTKTEAELVTEALAV
jgi:hypothetical protein